MKDKKPFYKRWWFWLIIIIVLIGFLASPDSDSTKDNNNPTKKDDQSIVYLKNTKASEFYKILCEVTGLREKSSTALLCDTVEYSSYDTNYQIEIGANAKTDEIAYITITQLQASDPTNAFMALNRLDYNGKDAAKLTDFITTNKRKTGNVQIGDLKFSTWISSTSGKQVLDARALNYDNYIEKCN